MTFPFFRTRGAAEPEPEDALGLPSSRPKQRYRSIWISDVHLGIPEAKADILYDFLKHTESEFLYLVGDIVDGWRLARSWYWPQIYNNLVRTILGKAKNGASVIFIPGNHDEVFRQYVGMDFGFIAVRREAFHLTADGRRLLVLHGDEFDGIIMHHRWVSQLGSVAYDYALKLNRWLNILRDMLGFPYWSLSMYLKRRVKNAVKYMNRFEEAVMHEAQRRKVDGLVCGHIHHAALTKFGDVTYCNDGDWVESCTALVEHYDGRLELLNWNDVIKARNQEEQANAVDHRVGRLATAG